MGEAADEGLNDRVEELIDAGLMAIGAKAVINGADGVEMVLAATALSVRLALAGCKSHEDARAAIQNLTDDYFAQARKH